MILKGDTTVNAAIDNTIIRESQWTQKRSATVACESVHNYVVNLHCPQGEMSSMPDQSLVKEKAKLIWEMSASVKKKVYSDSQQEQKRHLDTLMKQGDYLKFADQEKLDPSWNSILG